MNSLALCMHMISALAPPTQWSMDASLNSLKIIEQGNVLFRELSNVKCALKIKTQILAPDFSV